VVTVPSHPVLVSRSLCLSLISLSLSLSLSPLALFSLTLSLVTPRPMRLVGTWILQTLFGLHGVFAYLAATLVGMALGVALEAQGRVTRGLLAVGLLGCVVSFSLAVWQMASASAQHLVDRLLMRRAAAHSRLLFGAMDTAIILLLLGVVESVPGRRAAWEASTTALRRFARLSFTMYTIHEIVIRLIWLPLALGLPRLLAIVLPLLPEGWSDGWDELKFAADGKVSTSCRSDGCLRAHAMLCLGLLLTVLAILSALLGRWSQSSYCGSFEAFLMARSTPRAAARAMADHVHPPIASQNPAELASAELRGKWPAVFAQIALLTWLPALVWTLTSFLALHPATPASSNDAVGDASQRFLEDEVVSWLLALTLAAPLGLSLLMCGGWFINAGPTASPQQQQQLRLPHHSLPIAGLVVYASAYSIRAAGTLFVPVPALGYFRADASAAATGLLYCVATRFSTAAALAAMLLSLITPCLIDPPRFYTRQVFVDAGLEHAVVTVHTGVISAAECEVFARGLWDQQYLWTKVSQAGALPYFSFGWTANFDGEAESLPLWSWRYGFRWLVVHESQSLGALAPSQGARRAAIQTQLAGFEELFERLRDAVASHLGVRRSLVIFGGEAGAGSLGHPSVQVYLPNAVWHSLVNPHRDDGHAQVPRLSIDAQCENASRTSFLLPLVVPKAAGLLHWNASGEHETLYTRGSLYAFPARLTHSIRPWPFSEWNARPRMTVQLFAMRCSGRWILYH